MCGSQSQSVAHCFSQCLHFLIHCLYADTGSTGSPMLPVTVVKATKPVAKKAGNPAKPAAIQRAMSTKSLVSSRTSTEVEDIEDEDERTSSIQPINPHHVLEKADGSDDELNDDIQVWLRMLMTTTKRRLKRAQRLN